MPIMAGLQRHHAEGVASPSAAALSLFSKYLHWYVPRAFHAVRLAHEERFPRIAPDTPAIICLNHPSWWDPLIGILLSRCLAPQAQHYAPMEAAMLRHYSFMRKLGLFPVDTGSPQAGAQFLRAAHSIFARPLSMLWVTPEGHFTDVRCRPAEWRPGVAALVARQSRCVIVPLALEYTFWDERLPEALALVGSPLLIEDGQSRSAAHWHAAMTSAMTYAQEELAALSMTRDPAAFRTLLQGRRGVTAAYNLWKRLQARRHGRPYVAEHSRLPRV